MTHPNPASPIADAIPTDPTGSARALVELQIAVLSRLAEMGMQIAEAATLRAVAALEGAADAVDRSDPTLAYARAARVVRMCFALQSRLLGELPALERAEGDARYEQRHARKKQIVHLVKKAADADPDHAYVMADVSHACWERLRDTDEYSEMMTLPLREAVARICKDLDIPPDWSLWGEALPPPGEVPDAVGGRGLQGADARESALQPPSSASQTLPPEGEDQAGESWGGGEGLKARPPPPGPPNPIARPPPPG